MHNYPIKMSEAPEKIRDGIAGCTEKKFELPEVEKAINLKKRWDRHVPQTGNTIEALLKLVDRVDPLKMLFEVNEDILGAYIYRVPPRNVLFPSDLHNGKIELYWGIIGLVAGMLGVSVELLTTVVLIHELAHAYTHVGADIDGYRWDSIAFADASVELKEGLAQYYTHTLCRRMDSKQRGLFEVYQYLLSHQSKPYHAHMKWISQYKPEEVRLALISVRRIRSGDIRAFNAELRKARNKMRV